MSRCSDCGLEMQDMVRHLPFAHQMEWVADLDGPEMRLVYMSDARVETRWRDLAKVLLTLGALAWAGSL